MPDICTPDDANAVDAPKSKRSRSEIPYRIDYSALNARTLAAQVFDAL